MRSGEARRMALRRLRFGWFAIVIAVVPSLTVLTARPGDRLLYPAQGEAVTIYLLDNGFHTDLIMPAQACRPSPALAKQA